MSGVPIVDPGVLDAIRTHVNSAWARKVGGILLGRSVDDTVNVQGALAARQTEEYAGEIAFPAPVWEEAYAELDRFPGAKIVGWYHSHPGTGVSLSDYDRRLHTVLFGEPASVALVLDPVAEKMAWFGWTISRLSPLEEGEPIQAAQPRPGRRPGAWARGSVAAVAVLGLAGAGLAGYLLGTREHPQDRTALVQSLQRRLQAQESEVDRLHQALDRAQQTLNEERVHLGKLQADLDRSRRDLEETRRELRQAKKNVPSSFVVRYTVQPGDTLWSLAAGFYGDPLQWPKIFSTNRDRVSDPDHLSVGQVLNIAVTR